MVAKSNKMHIKLRKYIMVAKANKCTLSCSMHSHGSFKVN